MDISSMEPLMPEDFGHVLEDRAIELTAKSSALCAQLNPCVQQTVGDLLRSINCYYSNLIEGHDTHPRDIDRALREDFSVDKKRRTLQLEAVAHVEVQKLIDRGQISNNITSLESIRTLHQEFCKRLPEELLWVSNPDTGEKIKVEPGLLRCSGVIVGRHIPPEAASLEQFLKRFEQAYNPARLSKLRQIIAVAASHHRLLWIHPFYDGNGRVTRLFSHAFLRQIGIGNDVWSVARGLARRVEDYKRYLMQADLTRQGSLDGRGALSEKSLVEFCRFFLDVCIDQIEYMESLLSPNELLGRIEVFAAEEIAAKRLLNGSFSLLREALFAGEFDRGRATLITGYKERQARTVLNQLVTRGMLVSETPKSPVRLAFPIDVIERWLPNLYPGHI